jgi:hypothetical protein
MQLFLVMQADIPGHAPERPTIWHLLEGYPRYGSLSTKLPPWRSLCTRVLCAGGGCVVGTADEDGKLSGKTRGICPRPVSFSIKMN